MTITRYFQRTISIRSTVRPHATEIGQDILVFRARLVSRSTAFENHYDYTDQWDGVKISVKIHSFAGESFGILQFIEVTGEEDAVQREAEYICHI